MLNKYPAYYDEPQHRHIANIARKFECGDNICYFIHLNAIVDVVCVKEAQVFA